MQNVENETFHFALCFDPDDCAPSEVAFVTRLHSVQKPYRAAYYKAYYMYYYDTRCRLLVSSDLASGARDTFTVSRFLYHQGPPRLQRRRHILKMTIGVIFKNYLKPICTAPICLVESESRLALHGITGKVVRETQAGVIFATTSSCLFFVQNPVFSAKLLAVSMSGFLPAHFPAAHCCIRPFRCHLPSYPTHVVDEAKLDFEEKGDS